MERHFNIPPDYGRYSDITCRYSAVYGIMASSPISDTITQLQLSHVCRQDKFNNTDKNKTVTATSN